MVVNEYGYHLISEFTFADTHEDTFSLKKKGEKDGPTGLKSAQSFVTAPSPVDALPYVTWRQSPNKAPRACCPGAGLGVN